MRRGHRGAGDCIGGIFASPPRRNDVESRSENVITASVVGEVSTFVGQGRCTHGYCLFSRCRRILARVRVVIPGSDGEMDSSIYSCIHGEIERDRLSAAKAHICGAAFEAFPALATLGSLDLFDVTSRGPFDAFDDIRHRTSSV